MPTIAKKSRKTRLREYLAERSPAVLTEREWRELGERLAPITESYLRRLLADAGVAVEPPFGGVRQKTFEDLEKSLIDMEAVYARARESGNLSHAQYCRNVVIQAKDHARLAARSPKTSAEKKTQKEEMVRWMLVWLENPGVFPSWVRLRKQKM